MTFFTHVFASFLISLVVSHYGPQHPHFGCAQYPFGFCVVDPCLCCKCHRWSNAGFIYTNLTTDSWNFRYSGHLVNMVSHVSFQFAKGGYLCHQVILKNCDTYYIYIYIYTLVVYMSGNCTLLTSIVLRSCLPFDAIYLKLHCVCNLE